MLQDSRQLSPRSLPVVEVKGGVTARQEWAMNHRLITKTEVVIGASQSKLCSNEIPTFIKDMNLFLLLCPGAKQISPLSSGCLCEKKQGVKSTLKEKKKTVCKVC